MAGTDKLRNRMLALYDKYEKAPAKKIEDKVSKYLLEQSGRIQKHVEAFDDKKSKPTKKEAEKQAEKVLKAYNFEADVLSFYKSIFPLLVMSGDIGNNLSNLVLYADAKDYKTFAIIEPKYLKFLKDYGLNQAKQITDTTKLKARSVIAEGIEKGLSYSDIGKNISDKFIEITPGRAKTIAETEVHTTFMATRELNAQAGGFKEKLWLSSKDKSVRPRHQVFDKVGWVPFDYLWDSMAFPGDPRGSARNTIRCRCDLLYR